MATDARPHLDFSGGLAAFDASVVPHPAAKAIWASLAAAACEGGRPDRRRFRR